MLLHLRPRIALLGLLAAAGAGAEAARIQHASLRDALVVIAGCASAEAIALASVAWLAHTRLQRAPGRRHQDATVDVRQLPVGDENEIAISLGALAREGAGRMIATALEAEVAEYIERFADERDEDGRRTVVRNGHARERQVTVGSGTVAVRAPRVNDKRIDAESGERMRFSSRILPAYARSPKVIDVLPVLYLRGLSTGDFRPALEQLLGEDAAGLSPSTISRLCKEWEAERQRFGERSLRFHRYAYLLVDGVDVSAGLGEDDRLCLLVVIGVREDGTEELLAVEDGDRESTASWASVMRDLKHRGLNEPKLVIGDGALGTWAAVRDVFPGARRQACRVHASANVHEPARPEAAVVAAAGSPVDVRQARAPAAMAAASALRAHCAGGVRRVHGRVRIAFRPRLVLAGVLVVVAAVGAVAVRDHAASSVYLLYVGVTLVIGAVAWTTLIWMLDAWRTPASLDRSGLDRDDVQPAYSFSLIVPARHEEAVLETTLMRLVASTHPAFEVLVVVGSDDPGTGEVARRVAARHPELVRVVVDSSWPKSKPKALNAALPSCRGSITGVFDAEDVVHPALLERVDQCFQRTDADVVQAGVQLMNFRSSWLTVRNVLEYYFWFRSRLHFHARRGFIPLGGNTVFIRTDVLRAVSGWDSDCLAEDCELGVRLSALGAHTVVFYEPELVTREECPPTIGAFARQRTRWNQGYLQTLSKGYWRQLPLRQRLLGAYTLAMPYLMAIAWVLMPVAVGTAIAVTASVPVTLISFLPALPLLSTLAVEVVGLHEFCRTYGERASPRDYGRLVLGLPVYQAVLAFAAARAVVREARGARGWEKTAHTGLHLAPTDVRELRPRVAERSLRPSLVTSGGGVELDTAVASLGAGPSSSRHPWFGEPVEAPDQPGGAVTGSRGPPPRLTDDLFGVVGAEPLWVRLDAVSANGSASLTRPSAPLAGPRGTWLGGAHTLLWRAVTSRTDLVVQVALVAGIGIVQATNMLHWPATQFDEGTYVGDAWAVQHGALAPYTYSYGHPPLCWLFIALWTWASRIFGQGTYSIDTAREFMFAVCLISCSLLYTLARRLDMSRAFAAVAVVLFALSPLGLFFHRAVLLDNPAIAWALAAFVLARTPNRRMWAFAASGACFAACVLTKETMLPLLPALLVAAAQNADRRTRRYCLTLFGSFLALVAAAYPLYATLKGELLPGRGHVSLVGYEMVQLFTRQSTGNVFDPHSLTRLTVNAWLNLDPWLVGAALLLSPIALGARATRAVALAYLIQVVMLLRPGYLPNMYVMGLLPFAALIVAGAAQTLCRFAARDPRRQLPRGRPWRLPMGALLRAAATAACVLALGASAAVAGYVVAPRWMNTDRMAMTAQPDAPQRAAERWLVHHMPHDKRLIVGDEFWIYLVEHGFDHHPMRGGFFSRTVVSYWPLDYDPAVKRHFPHGWRDFDYVISTQAVRVTMNRTPTTAKAIAHSRIVARFGRGDGRIEIRAINRAP